MAQGRKQNDQKHAQNPSDKGRAAKFPIDRITSMEFPEPQIKCDARHSQFDLQVLLYRQRIPVVLPEISGYIKPIGFVNLP